MESRVDLQDLAMKRLGGRSELKRIENQTKCQVEFCKRRNQLLKKAHELSVLCDAEVALIMFSPRGRLYEYSSPSSMEQTLQRYRSSHPEPPPVKCISALPGRLNGETMEAPQSSAVEMNKNEESHKLNDSVASLQSLMRNLVEENLGALATAKLEELESQLYSSLKHIQDVKREELLDLAREKMGGGKEFKRIEKKLERQIEFCKRRNKLFKKAYAVSVLCDAEVALIIFSPHGRLYEYSSFSSMEQTLQRYRSAYQPQPQQDKITATVLGRLNGETMEAQQSSADEMNKNEESHKLNDSVASLQSLLRNLVEVNLGALATAKLEELESQFYSSLKHIQHVKECMASDVSDKLSQLALEEGSGSGDAPKMGASSSRARL